MLRRPVGPGRYPDDEAIDQATIIYYLSIYTTRSQHYYVLYRLL